MRIRRAIIIPAILALGAAGSLLTGVASAATVTAAPAAHSSPNVYYRGATPGVYYRG